MEISDFDAVVQYIRSMRIVYPAVEGRVIMNSSAMLSISFSLLISVALFQYFYYVQN